MAVFQCKYCKIPFYMCDVELNTGETFNFCLWNCNSLSSHKYNRVSLIENYFSMHKVKMFALTETALKPEHNDSDLEIPGFSIVRNDLPDAGVLLYYRYDLSLKPRTDLQLLNNTCVTNQFWTQKGICIFSLS